MQSRAAEFEQLGCQILAIASGEVEDHAALARRIDATFPILADPGGAAIGAYGVLHPGALPFTERPIARPAELLIDAGGVIRLRFVTDNWRVRERAERLLAELRRI